MGGLKELSPGVKRVALSGNAVCGYIEDKVHEQCVTIEAS